MRLLGTAFRAVLVELVGVVLVLWALFGTATWTIESFGRPTSGRATAPARNDPPVRAEYTLVAAQTAPTVDSAEVARRLDHYSAAYRRAAQDYLSQLAR